MVRVYARKSVSVTGYTKEALKQALYDIQQELATQYDASKKFNIPQMTLSYHRRGIKGIKNRIMGRYTAIPPEAKLTECIISMEEFLELLRKT